MTEQQQLSYYLLDLILIFGYISDSIYPYQIPYNYTGEVTNRFKGIHKKKKCKKATWLSEEALQIAERRRDMKRKGEKERHTHLNAVFQRIERRDKKAFRRDQCKEIEENNRMEKTRDLFQKIRDTKGTFHAKMNTVKDRNLAKAMVFPVAMYGCESWTVKKPECQRINAFALCCWRGLLRVPGIQGDPTSQS